MKTEPTVFVVDDDEAMRSSLKWLIESVGLPVATYDSANAFLQDYYPGRSGCLVLDVRMPGISGLELQEHLVSEHIRIPVVIITGHGDIAMAVRALKAGALDFIEKMSRSRNPTYINPNCNPSVRTTALNPPIQM